MDGFCYFSSICYFHLFQQDFSKLENLILGTMYSRDVTPFKKHDFFFSQVERGFSESGSQVYILGSETDGLLLRNVLPHRALEKGCVWAYLSCCPDRGLTLHIFPRACQRRVSIRPNIPFGVLSHKGTEIEISVYLCYIQKISLSKFSSKKQGKGMGGYRACTDLA